MSDAVKLAKAAREQLATALNALQNSGDVPDELMEVADPIAEAMSTFHRVERSGGTQLDGRAEALKNVRAALDRLQAIEAVHPAVDAVMEAVAASLSKAHALARFQPPAPAAAPAPAAYAAPAPAAYAAPAPAPAPALQPVAVAAPAPQPIAPAPMLVPAEPPAAHIAAPAPIATPVPAPAPASYAAPTPSPYVAPTPSPYVAPAPAPASYAAPLPAPAASYVAPAPAPAPYAAPAPAPAPVAYEPPAPSPYVAPPAAAYPAAPAPSYSPEPAAPHASGPAYTSAAQAYTPAAAYSPPPEAAPEPEAYRAPAPSAPEGGYRGAGNKPTGPKIVVELGTRSASNFYKGLAGNDVVEHGGVFVATYKLPKIGSTVTLHVLLPGNYEFDATAIVQWVREPRAADTEPGFGARIIEISSDGRQLVYRYARNREPLFYDDL